jgi:hypothetical protein
VRELFNEIRWKDHIFTLSQLGFCLVLLISASYYYFSTQRSLEKANISHDSQKFANEEAESFRILLEENMDAYREVQKKGGIGEPMRLQWLETLRRVADKFNIPAIEFTLDGIKIVHQETDPYWHPEVGLMATDMQIIMQLSHEGDLYNLLTALEKGAPGLFSVEDCRLRWLTTTSEEFEFSRLQGACNLRWRTLIDVTGSWEQATQ